MSEIIRHIGSVTDIQEGVIVHGCNAQGVMGSGVAKALRDAYPKIFKDYTDLCNGYVHPKSRMGRIAVSSIRQRKLLIVNGITQLEYGTDKNKVYVDYPSMATVMRDAGAYAQQYQLDLHFPLIGCGLANGDWKTVEEIIHKNVPKNVRKHLWELV